MKVALALGVLVLCMGVGVNVMHFVETLEWFNPLYLPVMSGTTVGSETEHFPLRMVGFLYHFRSLSLHFLLLEHCFTYQRLERIGVTGRWKIRCLVRIQLFLSFLQRTLKIINQVVLCIDILCT